MAAFCCNSLDWLEDWKILSAEPSLPAKRMMNNEMSLDDSHIASWSHVPSCLHSMLYQFLTTLLLFCSGPTRREPRCGDDTLKLEFENFEAKEAKVSRVYSDF